MPVTALPQPMLQPKVPSMWAQPGAYNPAADKPHFETELEINDFPQHARWKVHLLHFTALANMHVILVESDSLLSANCGCMSGISGAVTADADGCS